MGAIPRVNPCNQGGYLITWAYRVQFTKLRFTTDIEIKGKNISQPD